MSVLPWPGNAACDAPSTNDSNNAKNPSHGVRSSLPRTSFRAAAVTLNDWMGEPDACLGSDPLPGWAVNVTDRTSIGLLSRSSG
jgi:hypothetical protein